MFFYFENLRLYISSRYDLYICNIIDEKNVLLGEIIRCSKIKMNRERLKVTCRPSLNQDSIANDGYLVSSKLPDQIRLLKKLSCSDNFTYVIAKNVLFK